jgi:hypothetical protein
MSVTWRIASVRYPRQWRRYDARNRLGTRTGRGRLTVRRGTVALSRRSVGRQEDFLRSTEDCDQLRQGRA